MSVKKFENNGKNIENIVKLMLDKKIKSQLYNHNHF